MTSKHDIVDWFEREYGIRFRHVTGDEYASRNGCPFCGSSSGVSDRFHVWREAQNYWCRQCGEEGFLDELTGENQIYQTLSDHERRLRRIEQQARIAKREREEMRRRLAILERMHQQTDIMQNYFENLVNRDNDAFEYWLNEGMDPATIEHYKLGYCYRCPTDLERRASYTIPVVSNGKLWNIRHRLKDADTDKYRPHMAGLPAILFNADDLRSGRAAIAILEGEKKSMIARQIGIPNVATMGKSAFDPDWAGKFDGFDMVYVAYDPDALDAAVQTAQLFGKRGRVVELPYKLDDMVVQYGATRQDVLSFFRNSRRIDA